MDILTKNIDVRDRDLILVDDIISTGGSIIKSTQFLKKQKCKRVFVACTHALLVNDAENKIKKAGVTEIISTNTIPKKTSKVDVSKIPLTQFCDANAKISFFRYICCNAYYKACINLYLSSKR